MLNNKLTLLWFKWFDFSNQRIKFIQIHPNVKICIVFIYFQKCPYVSKSKSSCLSDPPESKPLTSIHIILGLSSVSIPVLLPYTIIPATYFLNNDKDLHSNIVSLNISHQSHQVHSPKELDHLRVRWFSVENFQLQQHGKSKNCWSPCRFYQIHHRTSNLTLRNHVFGWC